jgi:hypothetical protein
MRFSGHQFPFQRLQMLVVPDLVLFSLLQLLQHRATRSGVNTSLIALRINWSSFPSGYCWSRLRFG